MKERHSGETLWHFPALQSMNDFSTTDIKASRIRNLRNPEIENLLLTFNYLTLCFPNTSSRGQFICVTGCIISLPVRVHVLHQYNSESSGSISNGHHCSQSLVHRKSRMYCSSHRRCFQHWLQGNASLKLGHVLQDSVRVRAVPSLQGRGCLLYPAAYTYRSTPTPGTPYDL